MKLKLVAAVAALSIAGLTGAAASFAADSTQKVGEQDVRRQPENTPPTKNWVLYTRNAGTGAFVNGPATPPLGTGSLALSTPTGADKVFLFNYDHVGTALADISDIAYSTYRQSGSLQQVAAINLEVDYNGPSAPGGFTTLVFEPVYNTDQGAVVSEQWQDWDAVNGGDAVWWSTKQINGVCAFTCYVSWSDIVAANPDATILGGVGVNQGSGNPGLVTDVDAFSFDGTTYDFENYSSPTTKDDCKKGGWQDYYNPTFKNQGDCVSWVNTGK